MIITVKHDLDTTLRSLMGEQKQVLFGTAMALTQTAKDIETAEYKEMRDVFDRPTPLTMNSLYVVAAKPTRLQAIVGIKDTITKGVPASKYLQASMTGGVRALKKHEVALRSVGLLPDGHYAVPGSGAEIDAFGNMKRSQIVQILAYFKTFGAAGYTANMTEQSRKRFERKQGRAKAAGNAQFFVGRPADGKLPLGIWQRYQYARGTAIKPIILFVRGVSYEKIFDFEYVGQKTVERYWDVNWRRGLDHAYKTAR